MRRPSSLLLPVLLFAAQLAVAAAPALAGPATQLAIDHVFVKGADHLVVVRATDDEGKPVAQLEKSFEISADGKGVGDIRVRSPFGDAGPRTVVVIVDGEMLRPSSDARAFVEGTLQALAAQLAGDDHVVLLSAGPKVLRREWKAAELKGATGDVRELAQDGGARVFDALEEGAREAARSRTLSSGLVLLLTHGSDAGSKRRTSDVLARATVGEGVTSVAIALLDGAAAPTSADRLDRLAGVTHGLMRRTTAQGGAASDFVSSALALATRYELRFTPIGWDRGEDRHELEISLQGDGARVATSQGYRLSEVSVAPWWKSLWVWAVIVLALGAAFAVVLLSRRRSIGLLVIAGGEDDGTWFELFELPLTLGSALQNDILLAGEGVSRNHCVIEREGRSVVLVDTNSEKGTFVNDTRIRRQVLEDEDRIRIGEDFELVYEARR